MGKIARTPIWRRWDFYRYDHRLIWRAIAKLIDGGRPADVITVSERLESTNELSEVGGLAYPPPWRRTRPVLPTSAAMAKSCANARSCGNW